MKFHSFGVIFTFLEWNFSLLERFSLFWVNGVSLILFTLLHLESSLSKSKSTCILNSNQDALWDMCKLSMDHLQMSILHLDWMPLCMVHFYTPVHLVESVENCGLCVRRRLACSSYANVMHCGLAILRALRYDTSARH